MSCDEHHIFFSSDETCPGCDAVVLERTRLENDLREEYAEQLASMEWVLVNLDRVLEIVRNGGRE